MDDSPKRDNKQPIQGIVLLFSGVFLALMAFFVCWFDPEQKSHEFHIAGIIIFLISTPLMFFGFMRSLMEERGQSYLMFCNLILIVWLLLGYFYFQTGEHLGHK